VENIADEYAGAHAVVCCFAKNFGKTCPNSVMEALACGRPALVTEDVGLAGVIRDESAGVVVPRTAAAVQAGLQRLREGYGSYRSQARRAAEAYFSLERATAAYESLYRELGTGQRAMVRKRKSASATETSSGV
jgi:glycosyltransferase involved in cell wall biosynthesis